MAGVIFPDFGKAIAPVVALEQHEANNQYRSAMLRKLEDEEQRRKEAAPHVAAVFGGDRRALGRVAAIDADKAFKLDEILGKLDAKQQELVKKRAEYTTQAGIAILNADPTQRAAMYDLARQQAAQDGIDVSRWPQAWSPATESWIKFNVERARTAAEYFKGLEGQPTPMGGAPMPPSGDGTYYGTLKTDESSGVNQPNKMGSGAFGYYQFMPKTWADVRASNPALNLPETVQQASPEQQRAAVEAFTRANADKLKAAGFEPNAANLYKAHRLGAEGAIAVLRAPPMTMLGSMFPPEYLVQNPDLRTSAGAWRNTVAGRYGKIASPFAAPAIEQGDGTGASPAVGPPAAGVVPVQGDPRESVRGLKLPPGARVMGIKGVPIVKDGTVMIMNADGTPDFIPLPQRKEAGNQPPAGPFGGNAMDAQAMNMLQRATREPAFAASPEYAMAHSFLSKPRTTVDGEGRPITIQPMDLSAFPKPTFGGAATPPATAAPASSPVTVQATPPGTAPAPSAPASEGTTARIPGGGTVTVGPVVAPKEPKPLTDEQAKAAGFFERMAESNKAIELFTDVALNPKGKLLEKLPIAGNYMQKPEYRQFEQARRDFINAILRRESGAVISAEEFANAEKQYFPQPGDDKDTIAQKARNREIAIDAMKRSAGGNFKPTVRPPTPAQKGKLLFEARDAIRRGAPREAVAAELRDKYGLELESE
ncbi:MAG TPA: hypothetical protein VEC14_06150 [Reyranellaceae bacterium]|nr:hypothetical protein [Reyranellaceae bacterium]